MTNAELLVRGLILVGQQRWVRLIGGVFLFYLGVRTFLARPYRASGAIIAGFGVVALASLVRAEA